MHEPTKARFPSLGETSVSLVGSPAPLEGDPPKTLLAFRLELGSMDGLTTALATAGRLGCEVAYVLAVDLWAEICVLAPTHVAHRFLGCLSQIIDLVSVSETSPRALVLPLDGAILRSGKAAVLVGGEAKQLGPAHPQTFGGSTP